MHNKAEWTRTYCIDYDEAALDRSRLYNERNNYCLRIMVENVC